MSNYQRYKQTKIRSHLIPRSDADASRLLEQVADYIRQADTRFDEVARLYLEGLTISDLQFMHPEDLINVVPPDHYQHRLLMSILVRRYLFRDEDEDGVPDFAQPPKDTIGDNSRSHNGDHTRSHNGDHTRSHNGDHSRSHKKGGVTFNENCKCSKCASH